MGSASATCTPLASATCSRPNTQLLSSASIKPLLRLYQGCMQAVCRLYVGCMKAVCRLYEGFTKCSAVLSEVVYQGCMSALLQLESAGASHHQVA